MHVSKYYSALRGTLDELEVYQFLVIDLNTLRQYRQDLVIIKFLSSLGSSLVIQVSGQILAGDNIPLLMAAHSRVLRISTESTTSATHLLSPMTIVISSGQDDIMVMITVVIQEMPRL